MLFKNYVTLGVISGTIVLSIELQGLPTHPKDVGSISLECSSHKNIYAQLAPTLTLMKMFMGEDFKQLPDGLRDNVKAFWSNSKFTRSTSEIVEQDIVLDDELTDIICKLITFEQEEQQKDNVVFYHGLDGKILFMYRYFAGLFSRIEGKDLGDFVLRGDNLYAINPLTGKNFSTVKEVRDFYKVGDDVFAAKDYGSGINLRVMHCNIALSASPATSRSTASSLGFMHNSFSVNGGDIVEMIISALVFRGMSMNAARACATEVARMYDGNFVSEHKNNGGILAISIPRTQADKLAMHVEVGGLSYDFREMQLKREFERVFHLPSLCLWDFRRFLNGEQDISCINNETSPEDAQYIYQKIEEYKRSDNKSSISNILESLKDVEHSVRSEDRKDLINEIALYLHPDMNAKIIGFFRYPFAGRKKTIFEKQYSEMVSRHVDMLHKNSYGSILSPTSVASQGKDSIYAIPYLIELGYFFKACEVVSRLPNFYKEPDIRKILIQKVYLSLQEGFDTWDFLDKTLENSFLSLVDEEDIPLLVARLATEYDENIKIGFLNLLRKKRLSPEVFIAAMTNVSFSRSHDIVETDTLELVDSLLQFYQPTSEVLEEIFQKKIDIKSIEEEDILMFMKHRLSFNPNDVAGKKNLGKWIDVCSKNINNIDFNSLEYIIDFYKLNGISYKELYMLLLQNGLFPMKSQYVECFFSKMGYAIRIGENIYEIDLKEFVNPKAVEVDKINFSALSEFFSSRFKRQYSIELISKYSSFIKNYCSRSKITLIPPEFHTWLDAFKNIKTIENAEKMIHDLDNLDILFCNLNLLDTLFGNNTKKTDEWFFALLRNYENKMKKLLDFFCGKSLSSPSEDDCSILSDTPISILMPFIKSNRAYDEDVLDRLLKYNPTAYIPEEFFQYLDANGAVDVFLEYSMVEFPNIIKNKQFVLALLEYEVSLAILFRNTGKNNSDFLSMPFQYNIALELVKVKDKKVRDLADNLNYPGTSVPFNKAFSILDGKYGIWNSYYF